MWVRNIQEWFGYISLELLKVVTPTFGIATMIANLYVEAEDDDQRLCDVRKIDQARIRVIALKCTKCICIYKLSEGMEVMF